MQANSQTGTIPPERLATLIALYLLRNWSGSEELPLAERDPYISDGLEDVLAFIEGHLSEDLSLKRLARVANFSPFHFARLFRESVHESPHQYVIQRRVEFSRYLILTTDWTLAAIALESGFASGSHLARHFKRATGVSPHQYRERCGKLLDAQCQLVHDPDAQVAC